MSANPDSGVTEIKVFEEYAAHVFRTSLAALRPVFDDPTVQEVMVNCADDVWIERRGSMERIDVAIEAIHVDSAVKALAAANNKDVGKVLDCRMPGYRIAAALSPVSIRGPAICIRKHAMSERTLENYLGEGGLGGIPADCKTSHAGRPDLAAVRQGGGALRDFLSWMVVARKNIAIAGSTSSGKTTFLNALLREVPHDQRVLTIEDTAELKVKTPNYVGLEAMPDQGVTIRALVRLALRFRPDRIIVGEVRGPETYDLLDAMNTGHSGGACSLHADSPELALARMESMIRMNESAANLPHQALREQIASVFDYVVFCSRHGARRGPERIIEVAGINSAGGYATKTIYDARELQA